MNLPDMINGTFKTIGAASIWMNVMAIMRDKKSRGVSRLATAFFCGWGFWNLYYYPHLGQWFSFAGGIAIVAGNAVWLYFMWRYRKS